MVCGGRQAYIRRAEIMKCSKCGKENLIKARFCSDCGNPFTDEERQAAYDRTIYGKLDKLNEAKGWLTLNKITSNPFVRIAVLALIIAIGFISGNNRGDTMAIMESDEYKVYYNSKTRDYFLNTDKDRVSVGIYLPGTPSGISVYTLNEQAEAIDEEYYDIGEKIILQKADDRVYVIEGDYENGTQQIRLMVVSDD